MEFTYEGTSNDCWLTDKLIFEKDKVIHKEESVYSWSIHNTFEVEINQLLAHLNFHRLTIQNFPGLEDYLKENYPNIIFSSYQQPTERELIENLVDIIRMCIEGNSELVDWNMYNAAKLYLNQEKEDND